MTDGCRLRVLFLTRYPVAGASSRYRVYQYLPYLEADGITLEVQSFMDDALYALSFSPGRTGAKLARSLLAVARRLRVLMRFRSFDVIYMQRELLPFGPPWIERFLKARGVRLVFDYDDALFIAKASRYNPLASLLRAPEKVRDIFRIVDLVVAGNNWLRDHAIAHGASAVTLEVAEDARRFRGHPGRDPSDTVRIGWLGSTSTVKYLRLIEPVLREVAVRYPHVRFELMGGGAFAMDGVPWKELPWSLDGEVEALDRWDIGLMPLPEEDWAKGKSGGKARTYMAAGVVPVCSAIGYNLELIEQGSSGLLCQSADEWLSALTLLIDRADLRAAMAGRAREVVEQRFAPEVIARQMAQLLRNVARGRLPAGVED